MRVTAMLAASTAVLGFYSAAMPTRHGRNEATNHAVSPVVTEVQGANDNSGHAQRREISSRTSDQITVTQGNNFALVTKEGAVAHWDTQFVKMQAIQDGVQRTYTFHAVMAGDTQISIDGTEQRTVLVRIKLPSPSSSARRGFLGEVSRRADEDISVTQGDTFQLAVKLGATAQWNSQFITLQSVADDSQRTYTFKATMAGDTQISVTGTEQRTIIVRIKLPSPSRLRSTRAESPIAAGGATEVLKVKRHETFTITVDEGAQAHEDPQFLE